MQVQILKNTFEPGGKKIPTIFRAGEVKEIADEHGKKLIADGRAVEFKPEKADRPAKESKAKADKPAKVGE